MSRRREARRRRERRVPRPERFLGPVVGSALLLLAWAGVAHASGSGWVQAVGATVAGLLVLGLAAPSLPAARLGAVCVSSPPDATAGSPVVVELLGNRPMRCTPRGPGGPPVLLHPGVPVALVLEPDRRGVLSTITVRLATAAPMGLLWWSRDRRIDLPRHLHVAPRTGAVLAGLVEAASSEEGSSPPRPAVTGDLRGVRPYEHGDGRRRIHWGASAHSGDLMVRESEQRADLPLQVAVDLPRDPDLAERMAEDAMATVLAHLAAGDRIVLETTEPSGRIVAAVADRVTTGRRLARAVAASRTPT